MRENHSDQKKRFGVSQRPKIRNRKKWALKIIVLSGCLIALFGFCISSFYLHRHHYLTRWKTELATFIDEEIRSFSKGFILKIITVDGGDNVLSSEELAMIDRVRGSSLITFDLKALQSALIRNPLIKEANLQKQYPDTLKIQLTRKRLSALAMLDASFSKCLAARPSLSVRNTSPLAEKIYIIDSEGEVFSYAAVGNGIEISIDLPLIRSSKSGRFKGDGVCKDFFHMLKEGGEILSTLVTELALKPGEISELFFDEESRVWEVFLSRAKLSLVVSPEYLKENIRRLSRIFADLKQKNIEPAAIKMQFKDQIVVVPKAS